MQLHGLFNRGNACKNSRNDWWLILKDTNVLCFIKSIRYVEGQEVYLLKQILPQNKLHYIYLSNDTLNTFY